MDLRVERVLSEGACGVLREAYDRHVGLSEDSDYSGWPVLRKHHLVSDPDVTRVLDRCEEAAVSLALDLRKTRVETVVLTAMGQGGHHIAHADNAVQAADGIWRANHTPNRVMTAMVYLSNCGVDFTGGELVFDDWGVWVAPIAGQIVLFPSDKDHVHRVERVFTGKRYALSIWLADDILTP